VQDQDGRFDREKIVNNLIALSLVSIAAATKPLYGLFALAVLLAICVDAWKYLEPGRRNRLVCGATDLLALFAVLYAVYQAHLTNRGMPNFPVSDDLWERLARSSKLLNANFTVPFRILMVAGLVLSPFLKRFRWLAAPLFAGILLWANTAAYDLRNILGFLLIAAFIPLYVAARRWLQPRHIGAEPHWRVPDAAVAATLAILALGLTFSVAMSDERLQHKFADEQLRIGAGIGFNQKIAELLGDGCSIFGSIGYLTAIDALKKSRDRMHSFFYTLPLDASLVNQLNEATGCTAIFYPPWRTHPSIRDFIAGYARARGMEKIHEDVGMELLVTKR
jgi:hypothetical protein